MLGRRLPTVITATALAAQVAGCGAQDPSISIAEWEDISCSEQPTPMMTDKAVRCQSTITIVLDGFGSDAEFSAAGGRVRSDEGGFVGVPPSLFGELAGFTASDGRTTIPTLLDRTVALEASCADAQVMDGSVSATVTTADGDEYVDSMDDVDVAVVCAAAE